MGRLWQRMNEQPRRDLKTLAASDVSLKPGVYVLYRNDQPRYVGKAKALHSRFWKNHMGRGTSLTNSALRRNVADI